MNLAPHPIFGISVCSGIGGLELAVRLAIGPAYRNLLYIERESFAASVLLGRMEDQTLEQALIWDSLEDFPTRWFRDQLPEECDLILSAGFPCQPASLAGGRKGREDERWLWPHIARLLRDLRPRVVFLENVPGLLSVRGGCDEVFGDLAELGYRVAWSCFSAQEVHAPHLRNRLFILARLEHPASDDALADPGRLDRAGRRGSRDMAGAARGPQEDSPEREWRGDPVGYCIPDLANTDRVGFPLRGTPRLRERGDEAGDQPDRRDAGLADPVSPGLALGGCLGRDDGSEQPASERGSGALADAAGRGLRECWKPPECTRFPDRGDPRVGTPDGAQRLADPGRGKLGEPAERQYDPVGREQHADLVRGPVADPERPERGPSSGSGDGRSEGVGTERQATDRPGECDRAMGDPEHGRCPGGESEGSGAESTLLSSEPLGRANGAADGSGLADPARRGDTLQSEVDGGESPVVGPEPGAGGGTGQRGTTARVSLTRGTEGAVAGTLAHPAGGGGQDGPAPGAGSGRSSGTGARDVSDGRRRFGIFPPGPAEREQWRAILEADPSLAPALKPGVRDVADGTASRVGGAHGSSRIDKLRVLGNGVVPATAALALIELWGVLDQAEEAERAAVLDH